MSGLEFLEQHPLWIAHRTATELPLPDVVQLELTAACDLRCVMCPLPHETRHGTGNERYEVEDLDRLGHVFAAASTVELTGFGEILCHPRVLDCLRALRRHRVSIHATTNGNRLSPPIVEAILAENLLDVLCVSVDAASGPMYSRIRRGGDFSRLRDNLEYLGRRRTGHALRFWLSFAAMQENLPELPAFVRWAHVLGAERVIVQHVFEAPHTRGAGLAPNDERAAQILAEAGAIADELGLALDGRNLAAQGAAGHRPGWIKDCPFAWRHSFIKANRRVAACAMVWEDLDFDSLAARDFSEIWRGEAYTQFRRRQATGDPPAACIRCQYFGWRPPTPLAAVGPTLTMAPDERGRLGCGWHPPEIDARGRAFRWTRREASAFLNPAGHPILELEAIRHPSAPMPVGEVRVGGQRFEFDGGDLWGVPLRLPVGALPADLTRVDIALPDTWNPEDVGVLGHRRLGLLVYGLRFVGDAEAFTSSIDATDPHGQLCRGWLPVENIGGRPARWMRERADLLIRPSGGPLVIEASVPEGLASRAVSVSFDGMVTAAQVLPADGRWRRLQFDGRASGDGPAPVTIHCRAERGDGDGQGALVSSVRW